MDIVVLGSKRRFTDDLTELITENLSYLSIRSFLKRDEFFEQKDNRRIDLLIVEVNTRNFGRRIDFAYEMADKNRQTKIVFLSDYLLPAWTKRASRKDIYLLDKKKEGVEIISQLSKIINGDGCKSHTFAPEKLLTDREEEIIKLIASGKSHKQVAEELGIVRTTVRNHLSNISEKFETRSQGESMIKAIELGFLDINFEISEEF